MIDNSVELKKLAEMHEAGLLSTEQFERLRCETVYHGAQCDDPRSSRTVFALVVGLVILSAYFAIS